MLRLLIQDENKNQTVFFEEPKIANRIHCFILDYNFKSSKECENAQNIRKDDTVRVYLSDQASN